MLVLFNYLVVFRVFHRTASHKRPSERLQLDESVFHLVDTAEIHFEPTVRVVTLMVQLDESSENGLMYIIVHVPCENKTKCKPSLAAMAKQSVS